MFYSCKRQEGFYSPCFIKDRRVSTLHVLLKDRGVESLHVLLKERGEGNIHVLLKAGRSGLTMF